MESNNILRNKLVTKINKDLKNEIFEVFNLIEIKTPSVFSIEEVKDFKIQREITFDTLFDSNVYVLKNEVIFNEWVKKFQKNNPLLEENGYFFENTFFKRDVKITKSDFIEEDIYTILIKKINFENEENISTFLEKIYSLVFIVNKNNNKVKLPKKAFFFQKEINETDLLSDIGRKYGLFFSNNNNLYKLNWFNFDEQTNVILIEVKSFIDGGNFIQVDFNLNNLIQFLLNLKDVKEIWNI